jgi:hypothetical protein
MRVSGLKPATPIAINALSPSHTDEIAPYRAMELGKVSKQASKLTLVLL